MTKIVWCADIRVLALSGMPISFFLKNELATPHTNYFLQAKVDESVTYDSDFVWRFFSCLIFDLDSDLHTYGTSILNF